VRQLVAPVAVDLGQEAFPGDQPAENVPAVAQPRAQRLQRSLAENVVEDEALNQIDVDGLEIDVDRHCAPLIADPFLIDVLSGGFYAPGRGWGQPSGGRGFVPQPRFRALPRGFVPQPRPPRTCSPTGARG